MLTSTQTKRVTYADLFRWFARFGGVILFVSWLGLVITESVWTGLRNVSIDSFYQAAPLAIVFLGYAVGWREELFGGLITLFSTAAYFLITMRTNDVAPGMQVAWFAAPGVLYLLAWLCNRRNIHAGADQH